MGLVVALLLGLVGIGVACAAVLGAFALAWDVSRTKFKKQLHGITARYEAALQSAAGGGPCGGGGAGGRRKAGPDGAGGAGGGDGGGGGSGPGGGGGGGGGVAAMYESFTMGWFNVVVQHLWLPVLEKFVSTIAAERLQIVLNEVLRKSGSKAPWRYIQSIAVEEVTFGLAPPQFQFCTAKYDPSRSYLLLTMNLHYHSSGFQAVLTPRVQLGGMRPFGLRLEILQLHLAGKLHLGLHLCKEPPGIRGIDYSFASPPEFDIQASPVGYLNLRGELPGLIHNLRSTLQRVINRRLVEPERRYLDLQRIYRNKHVQKVGGPGGCLRVCVIGGRNLTRPPPAASAPATSAPATSTTTTNPVIPGAPAASAGGAATAAAATVPDCDPYVELRFGREVFRTPIAHHTADPVFNWQFDIRLPADLASASAGGGATAAAAEPVLLYFRVLNARTLGEPEVLSRAVLDANRLGLEANANAARPKVLELTAAPGAGGGGAAAGWPRGTLSLQVSWLKALPKKVSPFPQDAARAAAAAAKAAATATAAASVATAVAAPISTAAPVTPAPAPAPTAAMQSSRSAVPFPYSYSPAETSSYITPRGPRQSAAAGAACPDGTGSGVSGWWYRGEHGAPSGAAAALNALATRIRELTGSAPMYGRASASIGGSLGGAAEDSHFDGPRRGAESSRSMGPLQHLPHSSLDESVAGGRSYSRTTLDPGAVPRGPHRGSLDSGSLQALSADSAATLSGVGCRAVRGIHLTANGAAAAAAAATAAPGIETPRASLDPPTEGGSGSGLAVSSPSVATPTIVRKLKKKGFRGGAGRGGSSSPGSGAERPRSAGGTERNKVAPDGAGAAAAGPAGFKHRRAISGLLSLGKWTRRFSHSGAAAPPPPAEAEEERRRRPQPRLENAAVDGGGGGEAEVLTEEVRARSATAAAIAAAAANAAAAAATANTAVRPSLDVGRRSGLSATAESSTSSKSAAVGTAAADGGGAGPGPRASARTATAAPPASPLRVVDGDASFGGGDSTAPYIPGSSPFRPTRMEVELPAAASAAAAAAATAATWPDQDAAGAAETGEPPGSPSLRPAGVSERRDQEQQPHKAPRDADRAGDLPPATPPQPNLPPRGSISVTPLLRTESSLSRGEGEGGGDTRQPPPHRHQQQPQQEQEPKGQEEAGPGAPTLRLSVPVAAVHKPEVTAYTCGQAAASTAATTAAADVSAPTLSSVTTPADDVTLAPYSTSSPLPPPLPPPSGSASSRGSAPTRLATTAPPTAAAYAAAAGANGSGSAFTTAAAAAAAAAANGSGGFDVSHPPSAGGVAGQASVGSLCQQQQLQLSATSTALLEAPAVAATAAAAGGVAGATGGAAISTATWGAAGGVAGGGPSATAAASGGSGGGWSSTLQSLAQVVKMQRTLQAERQICTELYEMLSEMTRKYEAMVRLRRFENHRALVEGARFQLHLAGGVRRVLVWYNESRGVVQVDPDPGGGDRGAERAGGPEAWPWPSAFAPQELERSERGSSGFPSPSAWDGVLSLFLGRSRLARSGGPPHPGSLDPLRCFSLHLEGGRCLRLQLPASGNGRSRDEWVDALQDLAIRSGRAAKEQERGSTGARPSSGLAATGTAAPVAAAVPPAVPAAGPGPAGSALGGLGAGGGRGQLTAGERDSGAVASASAAGGGRRTSGGDGTSA